jgi:response regulator RpfG family c-di-GMP phosphodiesterase
LSVTSACNADGALDSLESRVFRDPLPADAALLELERCRGTQFDPIVVDAFLTLAERTR